MLRAYAISLQALHVYAAENGSLPAPSDVDAARKVLETAQELAANAGAEVDFTPRLLANLASGSRGELSPLCAFFGGIVGQEVRSLSMKQCCLV